MFHNFGHRYFIALGVHQSRFCRSGLQKSLLPCPLAAVAGRGERWGGGLWPRFGCRDDNAGLTPWTSLGQKHKMECWSYWSETRIYIVYHIYCIPYLGTETKKPHPVYLHAPVWSTWGSNPPFRELGCAVLSINSLNCNTVFIGDGTMWFQTPKIELQCDLPWQQFERARRGSYAGPFENSPTWYLLSLCHVSLRFLVFASWGWKLRVQIIFIFHLYCQWQVGLFYWTRKPYGNFNRLFSPSTPLGFTNVSAILYLNEPAWRKVWLCGTIFWL